MSPVFNSLAQNLQLTDPDGNTVEVGNISPDERKVLQRIAAKGRPKSRPQAQGLGMDAQQIANAFQRRGGIRGETLNSDQASILGLGTASPAAAGSSTLTVNLPNTYIGQIWLEDSGNIVTALDTIEVDQRTVQILNSIPGVALKRTTFHSEGLCFNPPLYVTQSMQITVTVSAAGTWGATASN